MPQNSLPTLRSSPSRSWKWFVHQRQDKTMLYVISKTLTPCPGQGERLLRDEAARQARWTERWMDRTSRGLTFWPSGGALMTYSPWLLMLVASDREDSSTDPWLSFTVFSHSKCRAESRCREKKGKAQSKLLPGNTSPYVQGFRQPDPTEHRHSPEHPACQSCVWGHRGAQTEHPGFWGKNPGCRLMLKAVLT